MRPTMTIQEANRQVEQYVQQTLAAFPAGATLRLDEKYEDSECDEPTDRGPVGRQFASRSYEVTGLEPDQIPAYYEDLKMWWPQHGLQILKDDPRPSRQYLWAENADDGFRMAFQANDLGKMYLIASSPCVWPTGTPRKPSA